MRWTFVRAALILACLAGPATADSLVATRVIRAQTVLTADDVTPVDAAIPGALTEPSAVIGLEARVTLYPGRAVRAGDVGPPALVDRNAPVALAWRAGGLTIRAEGRALTRGGAGDLIRVMNLSSRTTVTGRLGPDGVVDVGPGP